MPSTPDIDVSALAEALNEKLDLDGGNATNDIKEMMAHMGMPSGQYISLTLPADTGTVTAPADGYVVFNKLTGSSNREFIALVTDRLSSKYEHTSSSGAGLVVWIPVRAGRTVQIQYNATGTTNAFGFYYANGTQHLASNS